MQRAVEQHQNVDYILVDGNMRFRNEFNDIPYESIVKGDTLSLTIAAASIIAKAKQCEDMIALDKIYPQYGFVNNKGYGTKQHRDAIIKHGVTPVHRQTFKRVREYL